VGYKPMLWFVKGSHRGPTVPDVIHSAGSDKNFHHHGQSESEFAEMIKRLTQEGAIRVIAGGTYRYCVLFRNSALTSVAIQRKEGWKGRTQATFWRSP
jgi:hypothetical protein